MYFVVNKMSYFFVFGSGLLLSFAYTRLLKTKCIQNVLEVQNTQFQCKRLPHFQCRLKIS